MRGAAIHSRGHLRSGELNRDMASQRKQIQAIVDRMKIYNMPTASKTLIRKWAREIEAILTKAAREENR